MRNKPWVRVGVFLLFTLMLTFPIFNISKAQTNSSNHRQPVLQQTGLIEAFNGNISSTRIIKGETVYIFATIGNFGDLTVPVVSLTARFEHSDGNTRFNENYTVTIDLDHRNLEPDETFTGTIMAEITNPEANYNVTIVFVAEDVYDEDTDIIEAAPAREYEAAKDIVVHIIDYGNPSSIVVGIGITFAIVVVVVVLFILYGWLRERRSKKKY